MAGAPKQPQRGRKIVGGKAGGRHQERKLVEHDPRVRVEAEAILRLKLADKAERELIADRGVIATQLAALAEDVSEHPGDYEYHR